MKEEVQSMLALSLAKAAAIVPGQVLTDEEMNRLVDDLFAVSIQLYARWKDCTGRIERR